MLVPITPPPTMRMSAVLAITLPPRVHDRAPPNRLVFAAARGIIGGLIPLHKETSDDGARATVRADGRAGNRPGGGPRDRGVHAVGDAGGGACRLARGALPPRRRDRPRRHGGHLPR